MRNLQICDIVRLRESMFDGLGSYPDTMRGDLMVHSFVRARGFIDVLCADNSIRVVESVAHLEEFFEECHKG